MLQKVFSFYFYNTLLFLLLYASYTPTSFPFHTKQARTAPLPTFSTPSPCSNPLVNSLLLATKSYTIIPPKQYFYTTKALTLFSRRNSIEKQRDNTCNVRKGLTQINKTSRKHRKSPNNLHKTTKSSNFALVIEPKQ